MVMKYATFFCFVFLIMCEIGCDKQVQYKMLALYVLHTEVCVNSLKIYYHSPLATPSLPHVGRAAGVQTVQILHVLGIRYQYTHAPINGKVSKPTWLY